MQQNLLPKKELKYVKAWSHGGTPLKKRRKIKRPLVPNVPTHVVFKAAKARGSYSFYRHKKLVQSLLKQKSRKFFVEIQDWVNMGNHLHLRVRFKDTGEFQKFLKSFSALLARRITGARKGKPFGQFWDGLVYTRVLCSKLEALGLKVYFEGNHRQRELGYMEREVYLKRWNQFLYRLRQTRAGPKPELKWS